MTALLVGFDELHTLSSEKYYSVMELSDAEIKKRITIADRFKDEFTDILWLALLAWEHGGSDAESIQQDIQQKFYKAYMSVGRMRTPGEKNLRKRAETFSQQVSKTTLDHIGTNYYTSADRALVMGQMESSLLNNQGQFQDAKAQGKRFKTWVTIIDGRERDSHHKLSGTTIRIDEMFTVGGCPMLYPCDMTYDPPIEEIINCRCNLKFL